MSLRHAGHCIALFLCLRGDRNTLHTFDIAMNVQFISNIKDILFAETIQQMNYVRYTVFNEL